MSDQFVAEIRIFGFNFPPTGWAFCNGQLLPISQNTALFSLLGTTYGGDGKSTFALPDLQGCGAIQQGQGQGLSEYFLGQAGGSEIVALLTSEMPLHTHSMGSQTVPLGGVAAPANTTFTRPASGNLFNIANPQVASMAPQTLAPTGGGLPHNNMMPSLVLNYCIALQGIFPARP